jgi:AcrR family transcriptional regulator
MPNPAPRSGRPRSVERDVAILDATLAMLAEEGYPALTIEGVARRAGVGRPTVYRRYPSRPALAVAALAHRFGLSPTPDAGTLRDDLLAVQRHQVEFFNDTAVSRMLPGLLADLGSDPDLAARWWNEFVAPRRASVHRALERAAARGEIAAPADPEWICDCLTGPLLARAFLGGPVRLDPALAGATTELVLAGLRAPAR